MSEDLNDTWNEIMAGLKARTDKMISILNNQSSDGDSIFPLLNSPYEFPPGRSDCFFLIPKSNIVFVITPVANKVLEDFNSKNGTDYELDECLNVCASATRGVFFHCNFTAKPKTRPYLPGHFSPKLFFAEGQEDAHGQKVPTSYSLLYGMELKFGCEMCPGRIAHPTPKADDAIPKPDDAMDTRPFQHTYKRRRKMN